MPRLPFLGELLPGEMSKGIVLVEFEPQSLWYESSFTLAAHALREGVQTRYHTFTHLPNDVEKSLARMGIDVEHFGMLGLLEILDSFTTTTGLGYAVPPKSWWSSFPPSQKSWGKQVAARIQNYRAKVPDVRKIHIDDNMSVWAEHDSEDEIVSHFRKRIIPVTREGNEIFVNAITTGVGSESFVKQLESVSDVLIEFKSEEVSGKIEQFARARTYRGESLDSSWRRLVLKDSGETVFASADQTRPMSLEESDNSGEFKFESERSGVIFRQLVSDFLRDYMVSNYMQDKSGWRSIVDVAHETRIPVSSLYSRSRNDTTPFRELLKRGMIEMKVAPGERGRGGRITRVRVAYEKTPVKDYVNRFARSVAKIERK